MMTTKERLRARRSYGVSRWARPDEAVGERWGDSSEMLFATDETLAAAFKDAQFADEIVRLDHKGWYCDDPDLDSPAYRGVVWELPARRGFVVGYREVGGWVGGTDGALVDTSKVYAFDDERGAAFAADYLAQVNAELDRTHAEQEREREREEERERELAEAHAESDWHD